MADHGHILPEHLEEIDQLSPYAVEFRYEILPMESEIPLVREEARRLVQELRDWVEKQVGGAEP